MAHLRTLRAAGRKGVTGAQGATGRLHEKFQGVLLNFFETTIDKCFVDLFSVQHAKNSYDALSGGWRLQHCVLARAQ